jgi:hypothetical protein
MHSPIRLYDVVLNYLSTGTTLPYVTLPLATLSKSLTYVRWSTARNNNSVTVFIVKFRLRRINDTHFRIIWRRYATYISQ